MADNSNINKRRRTTLASDFGFMVLECILVSSCGAHQLLAHSIWLESPVPVVGLAVYKSEIHLFQPPHHRCTYIHTHEKNPYLLEYKQEELLWQTIAA